VEPNEDHVAQFAAEELSKYLRQACGKSITTCFTAIEHNAFVFRLRVLSSPVATYNNAENPVTAAWRDGDSFTITTGPNGVEIVGGSGRGVLYGVYQFLECYLNVRWFHKGEDGVQVPRQSWAEILGSLRQARTFSVRPSFAFRMVNFHEGGKLEWTPTAGVNALGFRFGYEYMQRSDWVEMVRQIRRRGLWIVMFGHKTYYQFLPPKKYFEDHPEWSCLRQGKRIGTDDLDEHASFCLSNPRARQTFVQNVLTFLRRHPEIDFFYPWPPDGVRLCQCEKCRARSIADNLMDFDNEMAAAIRAAGLKTKVIHFAYGHHMQPPENSRPAPGIIVSYSPWGRDFGYAMDQIETPERLREPFIRWCEICRERDVPMIIHSKHLRLLLVGFRLVPLPVTERDFRYMLAKGVSGFDFHSSHVDVGWRTKMLNTYCVLRLAWDNSNRMSVLQHQFVKDYYGQHANRVFGAMQCVTQAMPHLYYNHRPQNYNFNLAHTQKVWHYQPQLPVKSEHVDGLTEYNDKALQAIAEALDGLGHKLAGEPYDTHLAGLKTMLTYVRDQRLALGAFCQVLDALDRWKVNSPKQVSAVHLANARKALEAAKAAEQVMATWQKNPAKPSGLLWDDGSCRVKELQLWQKLLDERTLD
jgi:hypothetical protein